MLFLQQLFVRFICESVLKIAGIRIQIVQPNIGPNPETAFFVGDERPDAVWTYAIGIFIIVFIADKRLLNRIESN